MVSIHNFDYNVKSYFYFFLLSRILFIMNDHIYHSSLRFFLSKLTFTTFYNYKSSISYNINTIIGRRIDIHTILILQFFPTNPIIIILYHCTLESWPTRKIFDIKKVKQSECILKCKNL